MCKAEFCLALQTCGDGDGVVLIECTRNLVLRVVKPSKEDMAEAVGGGHAGTGFYSNDDSYIPRTRQGILVELTRIQ